jgi:anti-anti-sigma factor
MSLHPPALSLEVVRNGDHIVVCLVGCKELHEDNAQIFDAQIASLVEKQQGQHLILNLAAVEYLTSTVLGKLVSLHHRLRQQGGRLTVTNTQAVVWEIFTVTRLNQVLDVHPATGSNHRTPPGLSA